MGKHLPPARIVFVDPTINFLRHVFIPKKKTSRQSQPLDEGAIEKVL